MTTESTARKRKYSRRSDEERIAELEQRIQELRLRQKAKERKDDPVMREIPKVQRRLRSFAQSAMDHSRPDIANAATAFITALDRWLAEADAARSSSAG